MNLRSGKSYTPKNQPFKMILLREKIPKKEHDIPEGIPPKKINFDEASKAWRKNKINIGLGMVVYK
jgi:hypothetical protein